MSMTAHAVLLTRSTDTKYEVEGTECFQGPDDEMTLYLEDREWELLGSPEQVTIKILPGAEVEHI